MTHPKLNLLLRVLETQIYTNKLTSFDGKATDALFTCALTASSFMDRNCIEQVNYYLQYIQEDNFT